MSISECCPSPLPVHPIPRPRDNLASWIALLALANLISFSGLFVLIEIYSSDFGFVETLQKMTGYPFESIMRMDNPFKLGFWKNPAKCPLKKCHMTSRNKTWILEHHLLETHKLGYIYQDYHKLDEYTRIFVLGEKDENHYLNYHAPPVSNEIDFIQDEKLKKSNKQLSLLEFLN